ncbi:MAG: 50S ribosomal protein L1 [Candidatus Methanolliviera hydrocarbonicum]|uniref:Large ribosomal subunit protein uL1 n=1 Tax=Candidatus Methanolliviera hydrocarbonicum TaxID=2491085 RepID=A0A520KXZ4_9EURY|nr:MAG: 50S ribosomal protein L1 [Candidatus Methanolliviera hydrocarbonicum]
MSVKETRRIIEELIKEASGRNFVESVDLVINLKNVDMKNPNNRIKEEVILPEGLGDDVKIAVFAKGDLAERAKKMGVTVLSEGDIDKLGKSKSEAKKIAREYDFFLAEPQFMALIGRKLGQTLGPRGKMPSPAISDIEGIIERLKKSVRLNTKDNLTFHAKIGKTSVEPEKLAKNLEAVVDKVISRLNDGKANIRSIYLKTTMGKAKRVAI